jgi:hypothetical protein
LRFGRSCAWRMAGVVGVLSVPDRRDFEASPSTDAPRPAGIHRSRCSASGVQGQILRVLRRWLLVVRLASLHSRGSLVAPRTVRRGPAPTASLETSYPLDLGLYAGSPNGVRTRVSTLRGWLERPGQWAGIESDLRKQSRQVLAITGRFCVLLGPFLAQPSAG